MNPSVIISLLLLAVATTAKQDFVIDFSAKSVRSDVFIPLRANKTSVLISECGKEVTEPLGYLEHTYKQGSAKNGEECTWKLHAPANHIVNIISISFGMRDHIKDSGKDDVETSKISLYDGPEKGSRSRLISYAVSPRERVGYFSASQSESSGQDMVVEIKYHDHEDFGTQEILIYYEFLEYEKMMELLRAYPGGK